MKMPYLVKIQDKKKRAGIVDSLMQILPEMVRDNTENYQQSDNNSRRGCIPEFECERIDPFTAGVDFRAKAAAVEFVSNLNKENFNVTLVTRVGSLI